MSFVWPLVAAFAIAEMAVFATSIYLHRSLAHRAIAVHPWLEFVLRAVLWITTGQNRREWVAVHRKHHAFADREGDPHSPRLLGFWNVQLGNVIYYMREARKPETLTRFAGDIADDAFERIAFRHGIAGPLIGFACLVAVFGAWGGFPRGIWQAFLAAGAHTVLYVFVLAPLINGLGHWTGQQNFSSNTAFNWRLLSFVTAGETLHNNHHGHPGSPKFSMTRVEVDPSWAVIRCLAAVGLVEIRNRPAVPA